MFAETGILFVLRALIFFSCRKYLLQSLYSDLQYISSSSQDDPLGALPTPSTSENANKWHTANAAYSNVSRTAFALCFSESCLLFLLLMFQGMDILGPQARLFNWRFSLNLLLVLVLVVIPTAMVLLIVIQSREHRILPRLVFSALLVSVWLFVFSLIPLPTALSSSDISTTILSRLIVLGTMILGLLSGFASISNIWTFLPPIRRSKINPTNEDIALAESSLNRIRVDLDQRRQDAALRADSTAESSWYGRMLPSFKIDDVTQEVQGLEALEYQMSRNLSNIRSQHENARYEGTLWGKLYLFSGRVFAIYCYFRVLSSVINVLVRSAPSETYNYPDIATYMFAKAFPEVDLETVIVVGHHIALVLVGAIILLSITRVLRGVLGILRPTTTATSGKKHLGASVLLLILAQLMVIYLLSTIVQLRSTFPPAAASDSLFSTIPQFEVFGLLFNWSFLIAVIPTGVFKWIGEKVAN